MRHFIFMLSDFYKYYAVLNGKTEKRAFAQTLKSRPPPTVYPKFKLTFRQTVCLSEIHAIKNRTIVLLTYKLLLLL